FIGCFGRRQQSLEARSEMRSIIGAGNRYGKTFAATDLGLGRAVSPQIGLRGAGGTVGLGRGTRHRDGVRDADNAVPQNNGTDLSRTPAREVRTSTAREFRYSRERKYANGL